MATFLLIALVVVLVVLERIAPSRREPSDPLINIGVAAFNRVVQFAAVPLLVLGAARLAQAAHLPSLHAAAWPLALSLPAYVIVMDLFEYLFHRAQHAVPFLWRMHALHHSDPCMNVLTAERHFWGDALLKSVTIWPAAGILVGPSAQDVAIYALIGLYHVFTHANLPVNYGRLSWLLNSPAYHRVHHSREAADHGANFSALFPIFDVILGSYRRPRHVPSTGLDRAPANLFETVVWPLRYE